ncbi:MAG: hypothetical protein D3909_16035, partial [Candidatus Electrothrix sp. ATG1]|nr:hypothetical protein [Candidatus Electrothrix sp. ATG1]
MQVRIPAPVVVGRQVVSDNSGKGYNPIEEHVHVKKDNDVKWKLQGSFKGGAAQTPFLCRSLNPGFPFFFSQTSADQAILLHYRQTVSIILLNIMWTGYKHARLEFYNIEEESMVKHKETASFNLTLFAIYKRTAQQPEPTFLYINKEGESHRLPFLQAEGDNNCKAVKNALHRLQPLARHIFAADRHVFKTAPKELADELGTIWHLGKDNLPLRFTGAGGISMEEDYLLLYLEVQPHLPVIDTNILTETSINLCNRLSYAGQLHGPEKKKNINK